MEAAAAAASESDHLNRHQQGRPTSPSGISNSVYQRQVMSSLSPKSKYPEEAQPPQTMDVVMNLSNRVVNNASTNIATTNHPSSIYTRWANSHRNSRCPIDVDASALHRLAEAAEWKQVRIFHFIVELYRSY